MHGVLLLEHASPLKFSQTFQFVTGESTQKINYYLPIDRAGGPKKGTKKRRARGYSGQI